ncbi:Bug family tripartite tricarboxylate transporter substrate binding protein [Falsiroseomonas sp. HC035]|uniref:Bug family tripartite tricarboxylate transporter substrate binding protein n=1 Tax=Falsiroseomonas sp. HC035 TaxID=3390999 RepID=UPI003D316062
MRRRSLLAAGLAAPSLAGAQVSWLPDRPMRLIVPFAPGGALDVLARLLAWEMEPLLGTTILVENRSGAGGNVGAEAAARSEPDGHTFLISAPGPLVVNPFLYPSMPFNPEVAFVPVALVASNPLLVLASTRRPERSLADLVTAIHSGARLNYSSAGAGSAGHLTMEMLKSRLGVAQPQHVAFRGAAPSLEALSGGHVEFAVESITSSIGFISGGLARALAVTTSERWPGLPGVPTVQESGVTDFDYVSWICFVYPAGVSEEAVLLLNAATNGALATPGMRERLLRLGAVPRGGTARQLEQHIRSERTKWGDAVRISGARVG